MLSTLASQAASRTKGLFPRLISKLARTSRFCIPPMTSVTELEIFSSPWNVCLAGVVECCSSQVVLSALQAALHSTSKVLVQPYKVMPRVNNLRS